MRVASVTIKHVEVEPSQNRRLIGTAFDGAKERDITEIKVWDDAEGKS